MGPAWNGEDAEIGLDWGGGVGSKEKGGWRLVTAGDEQVGIIGQDR